MTPSPRASPSTPMASRPSWILNGTASRESSNGVHRLVLLSSRRSAPHERPVVGVLERLLGVDAAGDPDVGSLARLGEPTCLGDRDGRRRRQQPPDAVRGPLRAQRQGRRDEGNESRGDEEQGSHRPIIPTSPATAAASEASDHVRRGWARLEGGAEHRKRARQPRVCERSPAAGPPKDKAELRDAIGLRSRGAESPTRPASGQARQPSTGMERPEGTYSRRGR